MDEVSRSNFVTLEPFIHQVGGHSSLLCLDESTICKPLVQRELTFYQTMPELLKKFTPNFYGVVKVNTIAEEDGYIALVASPPDAYQPNTLKKKRNQIRLRRSGSIEMVGATEIFIEDESDTGNCSSNNAAINPWVLKCHRTNLQNIMSTTEDNVDTNFIVLENLANNFSYPCILDLKMGTRQYGDMASLPKKQSKMFKVVSTTSGKLGVRIGGMQIFQMTTRRYICRNKFYGRSLSVSGFQQALYQFLHNGAQLRTDVLPPLIRRLEELVVTLTQLDAIRFYTTSLLLLYEGQDLRMNQLNNENQSLSLESLVSTVQTNEDGLQRSCSAVSLSSPSVQSDIFNAEEQKSRMKRRRSSIMLDEASITSPKLNKSFQFPTPAEPVIDVRIIDFAHTTHEGLDDPVTYSGPDRGFLFGLENIISLLKGIERDHG